MIFGGMKNQQNPKLFQILSTFSRAELNRLEKFVDSPYFNPHKETRQLFEILKEAHPDFEEEVSAEDIFQKIYPNKAFRKDKVRILFTYLTRLCLKYFALEHLEKEQLEYEYWAILELEDRELNPLLPFFIQKSEKKLEKQEHEEADHYLHQYRMEKQKFFLAQKDIHNRKFARELHQISAPLDDYYLTEKLRLACVVFHRHTVFADPASENYWKDFVAYLHQFDIEQLPILLRCYYHALCLYHPELEARYEEFRQLLYKQQRIIPASHLIDLVGYNLNYCGLQYRKGDTSYLGELFQWYNFILSGKLLTEYPSFMVHNYKNAVAVSLRLREFEWVEDFVEKYKDGLPEAYKDEAYKYNRALIAYYQGDFSRAKRFLLLGEFLDMFYKINRDVLLFKIYFEEDLLGNYELIKALAQAAINFVGRQKLLSGKNKAGYQGFFRAGRKLLDLSYKNDPAKGAKIIEIENKIREKTDLTVDKTWLMGRINVLKDAWGMDDCVEL